MKSKIIIGGCTLGLLIANFVLDGVKSKKEHDEIVEEAAELAYQRFKSENETTEKESE